MKTKKERNTMLVVVFCLIIITVISVYFVVGGTSDENSTESDGVGIVDGNGDGARASGDSGVQSESDRVLPHPDDIDGADSDDNGEGAGD